MPLCYGGGIRSLDDMKVLFSLGVEKIGINTHAVENPEFIREAADRFGSQSVVVSIDVRKNIFGKYEIFTHSGQNNTHIDPEEFAIKMEKMGAGELLVTSIDRDGTWEGYDIPIMERISKAVSIPIIACGGAASIQDFVDVMHETGVSAVAAGSIFVLQKKHRAVLITYPKRQELDKIFLAKDPTE